MSCYIQIYVCIYNPLTYDNFFYILYNFWQMKILKTQSLAFYFRLTTTPTQFFQENEETTLLFLFSIISVLLYFDTMRSDDSHFFIDTSSADLIVSKYTNTEIMEFKTSFFIFLKKLSRSCCEAAKKWPKIEFSEFSFAKIVEEH